MEPKSLLVGKRGCSFSSSQVNFQLALAARSLLNAGHLSLRDLSRAYRLHGRIDLGFPVASRISFGTEQVVAVRISVSGERNIMGLVRVQAIRDWKGDLRRAEYRILAFIIYHVL